jgi:hypothetical protein
MKQLRAVASSIQGFDLSSDTQWDWGRRTPPRPVPRLFSVIRHEFTLHVATIGERLRPITS